MTEPFVAPPRPRVLADTLDPEAKSDYFASLGRKSARRRLVLSNEEAAVLADAYAMLAGIAARARHKVEAAASLDQSTDEDVA